MFILDILFLVLQIKNKNYLIEFIFIYILFLYLYISELSKHIYFINMFKFYLNY